MKYYLAILFGVIFSLSGLSTTAEAKSHGHSKKEWSSFHHDDDRKWKKHRKHHKKHAHRVYRKAHYEWHHGHRVWVPGRYVVIFY